MEQTLHTLSKLLNESAEQRMVYRPDFFRLADENDRNNFEELLTRPGLRLSDELHGQVRELIKAGNAVHKYASDELDAAATDYLEQHNAEEYGVWVYYPWLNHVVHILDEEEYRAMRTNRNQYKITPEERDVLATKKMGVIGLSVGQSVAIALSMERSYGELRIADFDILELSNLNRIRSGVQDLGLLKTVSTARQIAEIDPFLNVNCFHEGLTEENIESFLLDGGKLDILIDECDGLDMKIFLRHKAKAQQIPVVMETSDRGMIDIERFDLEPNRSIMHGLIDHLDQNPRNLKGLTNEEKIPYMLPMLGLDTMSDRLKASMLEVEQSITTWPQLASDVILGGAVSASVCRRMSLGQFQTSGRFFVDVNEIVKEGSAYQFRTEEEIATYYGDSMEELVVREQRVEEGQISLSEQEVGELVEAAIWAPSGGNSQPWKWLYEHKTLYLFIDNNRVTSFLDYEGAGAYIALGAATENLVLKAHEMGLEVSAEEFPDKDSPNLIVAFRFFKKGTSANRELSGHDFDGLSDAIRIRLTNRILGKRQPVDAGRLEAIVSAGNSINGASVSMLTEDKTINAVGELIARVDRILITHKEGHHGFVHEIRWSDEEARRTKDGIDIATIDLSAGEAAGFRMAKNWSVVSTLNKWGGGSVFEKLSRKCVAGASAVGLITMPGSDSVDYFYAGRALERAWLTANQSGVSLQPMTGLTFMLHRLIRGKGEGLTEKNIEQLKNIQNEFYHIFGLNDSVHPGFLFRLLLADEPKVKALRRPVSDVLTYKN